MLDSIDKKKFFELLNALNRDWMAYRNIELMGLISFNELYGVPNCRTMIDIIMGFIECTEWRTETRNYDWYNNGFQFI